MTAQLAPANPSLLEALRQGAAFAMVVPALMTILWADNTTVLGSQTPQLSLKPDVIMCQDANYFSQHERCISHEPMDLNTTAKAFGKLARLQSPL